MKIKSSELLLAGVHLGLAYMTSLDASLQHSFINPGANSLPLSGILSGGHIGRFCDMERIWQ